MPFNSRRSEEYRAPKTEATAENDRKTSSDSGSAVKPDSLIALNQHAGPQRDVRVSNRRIHLCQNKEQRIKYLHSIVQITVLFAAFSLIHAPKAQADNMKAVGCCAIRNGTNGWDWSRNKSRKECLSDAHHAGLTAEDVFHYPGETCQSVHNRCGPNPCP
jgi:hypothetical protein